MLDARFEPLSLWERGHARAFGAVGGSAGGGWLATEPILERLPPFGGLRIFFKASCGGGGFYCRSRAVTDLARHGPTLARHFTLASSILLALAGAALVYFRNALPLEVQSRTRAVHEEIYPLLGAVLGYALKR